MSRLSLIFALSALALAVTACDDKSSDDDDDDSFGDDGSDGTGDWGDGSGDGGDGGGSGDGGDGGGSGGDGADGGGGDGADGGSGGSGGDAAPRPVEGTWSVTGYELIADPCGLAAFQDPGELVPSTLGVTHSGSTGFTVTGDGGDPSSCTAETSGAYDCDSTTSTQSLSDFGIDATMVIDSRISGFTADGGLDWQVTTSVDIGCEGSGCAIVEAIGLSFPCSQELDLATAAP